MVEETSAPHVSVVLGIEPMAHATRLVLNGAVRVVYVVHGLHKGYQSQANEKLCRRGQETKHQIIA